MNLEGLEKRGLWIPDKLSELRSKKKITTTEEIFISYVFQMTLDGPLSLKKGHVAEILGVTDRHVRRIVKHLNEIGYIFWFGNDVTLGPKCPDLGIHPLKLED